VCCHGRPESAQFALRCSGTTTGRVSTSPVNKQYQSSQHRADCGDPAMLPRHARAERSSALPEGSSCGLVNRQHPCLSNVGVHFAVNQEPQTGHFEFAFLGALGFQAICSGWLLGTKPSHKIPTCMGIILSRLVMRDFLLSFRRSCHHRVPSSFESCGEDELCAFILMRRLSSQASFLLNHSI
jgi:hypothetical protein